MMVTALLGVRWMLALILIGTGIAKLQDDLETREQAVGSYRAVPQRLARPVALGLPWLEISLAFMLACGVLIPVAGGALAALLVSFSVAIGWNLTRGRRFDCGCGGLHPTEISWTLVLRDALLAAAASFIAAAPSAGLALWPGLGMSHAGSVSSLVPVPMLVLLVAVGSLSALRQPELFRGSLSGPAR